MTIANVTQVLNKLQSIDTAYTNDQEVHINERITSTHRLSPPYMNKGMLGPRQSTEPSLVSIKPIPIYNKPVAPPRMIRTHINTPLKHKKKGLRIVTKKAIFELQFDTATTIQSPQLIYSPKYGHLQSINNTSIYPGYDDKYLSAYMLTSLPRSLESVSELYSPNSQSRQWKTIIQ